MLLPDGPIDAAALTRRSSASTALRARVHLSARRAGRVRGHPHRDDRRRRQARAGAAAATGPARSPPRGRASAAWTTRPMASITPSLRWRPARARHAPRGAGDHRDERRNRRRPPRKRPRRRRLRQPDHHPRGGQAATWRPRPRLPTDPITLEIIQSSLQAISDEMFAAFRKTAMSAIIYEVLDMGTGITDGEGNLASSGAGHSGLRRRARQGRKRIIEINDSQARSSRATSSSRTIRSTAASPT